MKIHTKILNQTEGSSLFWLINPINTYITDLMLFKLSTRKAHIKKSKKVQNITGKNTSIFDKCS